MSRLTSGDSIPQVQIQPAASPIQLNLLPAPGQAVGGNTMQQIAQSLSVFNSGLMAFGQAAVNQQNRQAVQRGESIDFSEVIARGDNLNKSFKQIVNEMGLPDTANPYMMAAAERNFGSMVALKVRNSILSRMAELSDPSMDSGSQSNLLRQIVAEETQRWGGNRLAGNFYANNAFGEAVNEFLPGIEQQIGNEYLKNKESQALSDLESGFAEVLLGAMNDGASADEYGQLIAGKIMTLQRFTSDTAKVQGALYRATVTAFQNATSEDQLDNIYDAALSIPFGQKGTVGDNIGLKVQLSVAKKRAEDDMARKGDEDQRRFELAVGATERQLNQMGFNSAVFADLRDGKDPLETLEKFLGQLEESGTDKGVLDYVRRSQLSIIAQQANQYNSIERGDNREAKGIILRKIYSGEFTTVAEVLAASDVYRLDPTSLVQVFETVNSSENRVVQSIPIEREATVKYLARYQEQNAGEARFNEFEVSGRIDEEALRQFTAFINNEMEFEGKTFAQYQSQGRGDANTALVRLRSKVFTDIRQAEEQRLLQSAMASRDRATATVSQSERGFNAKNERERLAHVKATVEEIRDANSSVYDAFGFSPTGMFSGRLGDPNRVARLLSQIVGADETGTEFTVRASEGPSLLANTTRKVVYDGNMFRIYGPGQDAETGQVGPYRYLIMSFTREEMAASAINLKMQRLTGFTAREVISNQAGVLNIPFSAIKAKTNGVFDWTNIPVFESVEELMAFDRGEGFGAEDKQALFLQVLGPQADEKTRRSFMDAQRILMDERNIYRNRIR